MSKPAEKYRLTDDQRAMAEAYFPLAATIVKKCIRRGIFGPDAFDDALEVAMHALCYACHAWDGREGIRPATYLGLCVERAILRWRTRRAAPLGYRTDTPGEFPKTSRLDPEVHDWTDHREPRPEDRAAAAEVAALVYGQLRANEPEVFDMVYAGGLNNQEAADRMNLSRERVRQIHTRAIRRIREAIHVAS